jgi:hypothetical protein
MALSSAGSNLDEIQSQGRIEFQIRFLSLQKY